MSEYSFQTIVAGQPKTVLAGFNSRTASFYGMLFDNDLNSAPAKATKPLATENELFSLLESWGVNVPPRLEEEIESDLLDWEFGDGLPRQIDRKTAYLGFVEPVRSDRKKRFVQRNKSSGNI